MTNTQNAKKWYERLHKAKRWQRFGWNAVYYLGRVFSFGRWNPLRNFQLPKMKTAVKIVNLLNQKQKSEKKQKIIVNEPLNDKNTEKDPTVTFELSPFESFPDEILLEIQKSLDLQSVGRLAQTNKNLNALFQPESDIKKLLQYVAYGQQAEAEEILKKYPKLLLKKATVTDYSGRTFENITAFQYALWARDRHMWVMLRKYLSDNEARHQLNELEKRGTAFGKCFDFGSLINAMKDCITSDGYYCDRVSKILTIGKHQRNVPAHVAQYLCNSTDISRDKTNFEEKELKRSLTLHIYPRKEESKLDCWFPLSSSPYQLGDNCIIERYYWLSAHKATMGQAQFTWYADLHVIKHDLITIQDLCERRNKEYEDLKLELNIKPTLTI